MRVFGKKITVTTGESGEPSVFRWQSRDIRVRRILDSWREIGCWWDGEKPRTVYLAEGAAGTAYELHQIDGAWILAKVFD